MRYEAFITVPNYFEEDYVKGLVVKLHKSERLAKLKKGVRIFFVDVMSAFNGDDFVKDQYTVRIRYNGYRIPRIIKNHLLKSN